MKATLLNVTFCVRLHTLLYVVASWWELSHPFAHNWQNGRNNTNYSEFVHILSSSNQLHDFPCLTFSMTFLSFSRP